MDNELPVPTGPTQSFEQIKHVDAAGEYWTARELMSVLGYTKWENFARVIAKATLAAVSSGQEIAHHFPDIRKEVPTGSGASVPIADYRLSRYACYLIAQNGDPTKEAIALAQTYFAIQSRRQELLEGLPSDQKRLLIGDEIAVQNKRLFSTARTVGVKNFGRFNDAGYKGLYGGLGKAAIQRKKGLGKDSLLDRAGATELAANLFRITQTDEQLKARADTEGSIGEEKASGTHYTVGKKVRKAIADIGGRMPENLSPEEHIKSVKKRIGGRSKPKRLPPPSDGKQLAA